MTGSLPQTLIRLLRCTRGTSLIEMGLLMPLLLVLMGGLLEVGRALHHHHVLETSVRDAARYLARVPDVGQPVGTPCGAPPAGSAAETARKLAMYGTTLNGVPPLLVYWSDDQPQEVCIETATRSLTDENGVTFDVPVIRMTVAMDYEDLGLLGLAGLDAVRLTASHEEIHVGG